VFGNTFTVKKKTSKRGEKCYNYVTEQRVIEVAIELMSWDLRNLDYISQEIVQTYDLKRRKENDQHNKEMAEAS
jgi:ribosomal protein S10